MSIPEVSLIISLDVVQKKGFFVDCGAQDGESSSDTIYLEHKHGWTGILIEAHPDEYKKLEARNRQAHLLPTCLSLEPFPTKVSVAVVFHIFTIR